MSIGTTFNMEGNVMIDFESGLECEEECIEICGNVNVIEYPEDGHDQNAFQKFLKDRLDASVENAKNSVLDARVAKYQFDQYLDQVSEMVESAKAHTVTDMATNETAVAMAGQAKAITARIEKLRKSIVDAPNQFVKSVNNFAKQYTGKLADIESNLKTKINRYQVEQQRARIEAQRRADEEAKKLQEMVNQESKAAGLEPVVVAAPVIPAAVVTRTDNGSASLRKVWAWKLVNFNMVPDELKTINDKAVNQAVKSGVRNIPGIEIYEESQTVIRAASVGNYGDMKF